MLTRLIAGEPEAEIKRPFTPKAEGLGDERLVTITDEHAVFAFLGVDFRRVPNDGTVHDSPAKKIITV